MEVFSRVSINYRSFHFLVEEDPCQCHKIPKEVCDISRLLCSRLAVLFSRSLEEYIVHLEQFRSEGRLFNTEKDMTSPFLWLDSKPDTG